MALSQSALSELLEAFRAGDGVDLIRESVRLVMQELIEAEASEVIGAGLCWLLIHPDLPLARNLRC
jgi:putative transposase